MLPHSEAFPARFAVAFVQSAGGKPVLPIEPPVDEPPPEEPPPFPLLFWLGCVVGHEVTTVHPI